MQSDDSYLLTCLITFKNRDHWDSRRDRSLLSYRQQATRELKMASFKQQLINCRQQASKQASKGAREMKRTSFFSLLTNDQPLIRLPEALHHPKSSTFDQ